MRSIRRRKNALRFKVPRNQGFSLPEMTKKGIGPIRRRSKYVGDLFTR